VSAAALDEQTRPLLQAGRLTHELEPTGYEALAGIRLPPGAPPARTPEEEEREAVSGRTRPPPSPRARMYVRARLAASALLMSSCHALPD
jgi:hypothetical protein